MSWVWREGWTTTPTSGGSRERGVVQMAGMTSVWSRQRVVTRATGPPSSRRKASLASSVRRMARLGAARPGGLRRSAAEKPYLLVQQPYLLALQREQLLPLLVRQLFQLVSQLLYFKLRLQVDLVVMLGAQPVAGLLTVLTHHDNRRLDGGKHGEEQVEENVGILVPVVN